MSSHASLGIFVSRCIQTARKQKSLSQLKAKASCERLFCADSVKNIAVPLSAMHDKRINACQCLVDMRGSEHCTELCKKASQTVLSEKKLNSTNKSSRQQTLLFYNSYCDKFRTFCLLKSSNFPTCILGKAEHENQTQPWGASANYRGKQNPSRPWYTTINLMSPCVTCI